VYLFKAQMF